ncbi:zinc ribbon domain-containing protein [Trichothermofontia sp.]
MSDCPTCHQPVPTQAIACPHCQTSLKAFGHPGIPLYRTETDAYLCQSCVYEADDTCTFPQRPYAQECTLYVSQQQQQAWLQADRRPARTGRWPPLTPVGWIVLGLLVVSLVLALR